MDQLGSYRLRKRLAVGGMGEVYLGEKIGPEGFVKPVVLKCVLPQLAKDRAFVQLFLDEARLAALLNHPNIAQVYDFGIVDGIYYIAMEYVPGYTVDDIRRKLRSINQQMPLQHVACIASQVCQGLHYAHTLTDANGEGLGLVHRDVSPHNLIVSIDGSVKIVDFGIAKARAGLTRVQAKGAVGKFGYMSPEQGRGEQVDGRSDVFSLGVCLWELVTNERLHDPNLDRAPGYSPTRPVRTVDIHRAEVPRQFTQILETALSIEAADRYNTCQDMHLSLERFQAAMTHYAGQAALAQYIRDLVEGRVENPEKGASGEVVQPASARNQSGPTTSSSGAASTNMDGAQKYEEVFGVTMEKKRGRATIRSVPDSWHTKEKKPAAPQKPASETKAGGHRIIDLRAAESDDYVPELAEPAPVVRSQRPTRASEASSLPRPAAPAASSGGGFPWVAVLLLLVLAGAGVGAFFYQEQLLALLPKQEPAQRPKLTSVYRVETAPPGASVFLDGAAQEGITPLEMELIPDVEYRITVKLKGMASKEAVLKASVGKSIRPVRFSLAPSGTLRISSNPPGATVTVGGRQIMGQVTPMVLRDVPSGTKVRVRAEIKGMAPAEKTVVVEKGRSRSLRFTLNKS